MVIWKTIRITKEAWVKARKAVADTEIDLDDFLSYVIENTDLDAEVDEIEADEEDEEDDSVDTEEDAEEIEA